MKETVRNWKTKTTAGKRTKIEGERSCLETKRRVKIERIGGMMKALGRKTKRAWALKMKRSRGIRT